MMTLPRTMPSFFRSLDVFGLNAPDNDIWGMDVDYDKRLKKRVHDIIEREELVSVASRNVRVIVDHGMVTLKGEVFAEDEKIIILNRAAACVGIGNIIDELDVIEEME